MELERCARCGIKISKSILGDIYCRNCGVIAENNKEDSYNDKTPHYVD